MECSREIKTVAYVTSLIPHPVSAQKKQIFRLWENDVDKRVKAKESKIVELEEVLKQRDGDMAILQAYKDAAAVDEEAWDCRKKVRLPPVA
jgi:hypothetical protein